MSSNRRNLTDEIYREVLVQFKGRFNSLERQVIDGPTLLCAFNCSTDTGVTLLNVSLRCII